VPGLINGPRYDESKARLCDAHPRLGELLEAVEWELLRRDDCDCDDFVLLIRGPKGPIRCYPISTIRPGVVVIFGFEDNGGERKVLLIDLFVSADADDEDD
jgi:hypothetical protein